MDWLLWSCWVASQNPWLNTLQLFLWGWLKEWVYFTKPTTLEELEKVDMKSFVFHPTRIPGEISWCDSQVAWEAGSEMMVPVLNFKFKQKNSILNAFLLISSKKKKK